MSIDADSVLPEFEPDRGDDGPITTRPALAALHRQQLDSLRDFRDTGIEDRRSLLDWLLRIQFRTLGQLPHKWFWRVSTDATALACVLTGPERLAYGTGETRISPEDAEQVRRRLVSRYLRPACRDAFRQLRGDATEWLDDDEHGLDDPETIEILALRPALDEHLARQQQALDEWLSGFDSRDEVEQWLHALDRRTFGEIKTVDERFDHRLLSDPAAPEIFVSDATEWVEARERVAARFVLPACNLSVRSLSDSAKEQGTDTQPADQSHVDL